MAAEAAALMFGVVALVTLGRRYSATLETMNGVGDERVRSLFTRPNAVTANVLALVMVGWWLITVMQGGPNKTLAVLGAVFAVTFVGACAVLQRRG